MQAEADLMKGRFSQASDKIMSKFKDLSSTIDDMEKNLNQLVKQEEAKAAAAAAAAATQGVSSESRSRLSPPKSLGRSMTASFRSRNTGTSS
jgi:outer membrane murein-binding lipoprotein Lpp